MGVKSWSDRHRYIRADDQVFHLPRQTKREREAAREAWRVLKMLVALVTVALFLLILIVSDARSAVVGEWRVNLLRGSATQKTVTGSTQEAAWKACQDLIPTNVASGSQAWKCQTPMYSATVTPDPCPPLPADETRSQDCPINTVGTWTQTRSYVTAPAPTCAIAGSWQPSEPSAGACGPIDTDSDGVFDAQDKCPTVPAETPDGCPPPPPPLTAPDLTASVAPHATLGRFNVTLNWTAQARATGYEIQRCTGATCTNFAALATSPSAGYVNNNVPAGYTFRYRVRPMEGTIAGPYSQVIDGVTPVPPVTLGYSANAGGAYATLEGASLSGSVSVRTNWCPTGGMQFFIDGKVVNNELTCPYSLVGDDLLYDTKQLANGSHALEARGTQVTGKATFTVSNAAPANRAPVIAGTPSTSVAAGSAYSFKPTASDPDGDTLAFTIQNRPSWAQFSGSNGTLSGTPTAAGTTSNISIGVSDGKASASLPPFTLTVTQSASGAVTLEWNPPTTNTDGTALTNLAGYIVEYGSFAHNLDKRIEVNNPAISNYVVGNLAAGTYYFALKAKTATGAESQPSNVVSKTL